MKGRGLMKPMMLGICCAGILGSLGSLQGCTVKAVGDPERPITIEAHITVDVRGLKETATSIEDYVSGNKSQDELLAK